MEANISEIVAWVLVGIGALIGLIVLARPILVKTKTKSDDKVFNKVAEPINSVVDLLKKAFPTNDEIQKIPKVQKIDLPVEEVNTE